MNTITATPITLESYRVPLAWWSTAKLDTDTHALYVADSPAPGLERVEVLDGGGMIALHYHHDAQHVTVLTKAPTEAMQREAARVIAEKGA